MRAINTIRVVVGLFLLAMLAPFTAAQTKPMEKDAPVEPFVYVGTYTQKGSKGIYAYRLKTRNLEVSQNITLDPLGLAAEAENPSFLEVDHERRLLFAVNEIDTFNGKPTGAVSAFKIQPDGKLTLINQVS